MLSVRAYAPGSDRKSRDCEGASAVKHPLSDGDHVRDHESGSVKCKKAQTPSRTALMMLIPVLVIILSQAQFLRRVGVASEKISVHQKVRVLVIVIAIEWWRAAIRAAHRQLAVI